VGVFVHVKPAFLELFKGSTSLCLVRGSVPARIITDSVMQSAHKRPMSSGPAMTETLGALSRSFHTRKTVFCLN